MRGGKRPGSGRKPGSKNTQKLHLSAPPIDAVEKPTAAQRMRALKRQVAMFVASGISHEVIAAAIGETVERLEKVFAFELEHGEEIARAEELVRLDAISAEGSVPASKVILESVVRGANRKAKIERKSSSGDDLNQRALKLIHGGAK